MDFFLTTARLGFRCWREDDLSLAAELWGDSDVMALMGGPIEPDRVKARLAQEIERMRDIHIQYWPFFLLESGQFGGCAGLRPREHPAPTTAVPQLLHPGATEAKWLFPQERATFSNSRDWVQLLWNRSNGRSYQMGYHLLPSFWRRGIATEAARAVIDHAFGALEVEALFAAHHPLNHRSGNVLLKLGFVAVGEELYPPTGLMHPTYRLLRG